MGQTTEVLNPGISDERAHETTTSKLKRVVWVGLLVLGTSVVGAIGPANGANGAGAPVASGTNAAEAAWRKAQELKTKSAESMLAALREAAKLGHVQAAYELGRRLMSGSGVTRDVQEGLKWLVAAAERKHIEACRLLGEIYEEGRRGIARDPARAVRFYRIGSDAGDARAAYDLGRLRAAQSDLEGALSLKHLRVAAERGDPRAQLALSRCFGSGKGVPLSRYEAYRWATLAARTSNGREQTAARELRTKLEAVLSAQDVATVKKFAESWTPVGRAGTSKERTYVVRPADTLHMLSEAYVQPLKVLQLRNSITGDRLLVGQLLTLPASGSVPAVVNWTVRPGQRVTGIAAIAGTSVDEIIRLNKLRGGDLEVGRVLKVPVRTGGPA